MPRNGIAATAILAFLAALNFAEGAKRSPVVRQADHILIESGNPKILFNFLTETLQLPIAWPIAEYQGFVSGGIGAGNVNLEIIRYTSTPRNRNARYFGLAFEPYPLADALRELQLRAIPHSTPEPYASTLPSGSRGTAWTTVALPSFSRPGMSVFLCEYNPLFLKAEVRRKQLANRLTLSKGGPLGLFSVSEIIIATTNMKRDSTAWSALLGKPAQTGAWRAGAGPAIRLVPGGRDGIREITLAVESPDRAKDFLRKSKLMGAASGKGVMFNTSRVQGLRIVVR